MPPIISDSPSTTSNGARLVSANAEIQKTIIIGNNGIQYQFQIPPDWLETISFKFTELAAITTVTATNPITISYETNNEALLNAPNNGYFELEAHPAKMMP